MHDTEIKSYSPNPSTSTDPVLKPADVLVSIKESKEEDAPDQTHKSINMSITRSESRPKSGDFGGHKEEVQEDREAGGPSMEEAYVRNNLFKSDKDTFPPHPSEAKKDIKHKQPDKASCCCTSCSIF